MGERDGRALRVPIGRADGPQHLARLVSAGLQVTSFAVDEPSLEDVFLRLTSEPTGEPA